METRRRRQAAQLGTVALASKLTGAQASIVDEPGWNPKSSSELFLGLLPYLLVFVVVPICLLLVCWCSKHLIRVCCNRIPETQQSTFWHRFFPRPPSTTTPDPTQQQPQQPTTTPQSIAPAISPAPQPATLFTNYTNYNPILEGELDLFPVTYNADETSQQCRHYRATQLGLAYFSTHNDPSSGSMTRGNEMMNQENQTDDPPPYYPEDPPPSYDSLFNEKHDDNNIVSSKNEIETVHESTLCVN